MDNYLTSKLFLPLILGTNRKERKSVFVAEWLAAEMSKRAEIETRLFDVRDFALPQDDYGTALRDEFPEWRDAVIRADGLVVVVPEYNHGYPGALKSVMDLLLKEYIHKSVAFVGVSAGPWEGRASSSRWCRWFGSWALGDFLRPQLPVRAEQVRRGRGAARHGLRTKGG